MCDRAVTGVKPAWHKSTDCEEERVVDRQKGREIKKKRKGNEVGLYWSDSTSSVTVMVQEEHLCVPTAGALLCSFTVFAQDKKTLFYIYAHGITACAHSHSNHTTLWDTQWTHVTTQLDLGRKALNPPVHQLSLCTRTCQHTHAH